jgi:hypothetical protein
MGRFICNPCSSAATDSQTQWNTMEFDFFLSVDTGEELVMTTELLPQYTYEGPAIAIPIIRSLYRSPRNISVATLRATHLLPKVLVSMVFCFFVYHMMGALLRKMIMTARALSKLVPSMVSIHIAADFHQLA